MRVKREKVLMVIHLRSLDKNTLERQVYEEQKINSWPGLASETRKICEELGIEDCNSTEQNKAIYKKNIISACHKNNEENLRKMARGKCERIQNEEYGRKEYLQKKNIYNVRQEYRTRFRLQPFAGNYSNDKRFSRSGWLCKCKMAREEEGHLISGQCPVYGDLTHQFSDLTNIDNLIQFFNEVLDRRDQLDRQEKENPVGGVDTSVYANPVLADKIRQSRE